MLCIWPFLGQNDRPHFREAIGDYNGEIFGVVMNRGPAEEYTFESLIYGAGSIELSRDAGGVGDVWVGSLRSYGCACQYTPDQDSDAPDMKER